MRIKIQPSLASGGRKSWYKHVTSVDKTKANGYAFEGSFLQTGEHDLPIGSVIIEKMPTGSVKSGYDVPHCGVVSDAEGSENGIYWLSVPAQNWNKEFLTFRDFVADTIAKHSVAQTDARTDAIAQIKTLMADHGITTADLS